MEEVREYERTMQERTNSKVKSSQNNTGKVAATDLYYTKIPQEEERRGGERTETIQLKVKARMAGRKMEDGDEFEMHSGLQYLILLSIYR